MKLSICKLLTLATFRKLAERRSPLLGDLGGHKWCTTFNL